ncbi:MAG: ParB/RepB/Spo0J family partition protein [Clostridia bacterium]|nr:ParB/RepB/Spo0J family partition protein [Clostridia bacterium]
MSNSENKELFSGLTFDQMLGLEDQSPDGKPLELDIDTLLPFPNQPFHPYQEDEMEKMVESIKENGVISPIVVRPKEDGIYEIISGHNRVEACKRAGFTAVPSFVREVDDDTAVILMVDSNLRQREELSDIEKAKAYELKMNAMKRSVGRKSKNVSQVGTQKRTDQIIAEQTGDSRNQIQRYIRLTKLIPSLQDIVEKGKLAFNPAVELSYLDPADQAVVQEVMEREETAPSLSQAQKLKKMAKDGTITDQRIDEVLTVEKPMYETITFRFNTVEEYFPSGTTGKEMQDIILKLLKDYQKSWQKQRQQEVER